VATGPVRQPLGKSQRGSRWSLACHIRRRPSCTSLGTGTLKPRCTTGTFRALSVNTHEEVRRHVARLSTTEAFQQSARRRRKVEMLFAHLKRNLNFRRLRLRGMTGARDECVLAATAQNLRKLVKLIGSSPPPLPAACA
jgi:hypothetical protein